LKRKKQHNTVPPPTKKFMQTLNHPVYGMLAKIAKRTGITVQDLIRARVVPEWIRGPGKQELKEAHLWADKLQSRKNRTLAKLKAEVAKSKENPGPDSKANANSKTNSESKTDSGANSGDPTY